MKKDDEVRDDRGRAAYPLCRLQSALELGSAVKELGGLRGDVSKESLAAHLKVEETSPSFLQRLSSTKMFGIVVGRGSFVLTEDGKKYFSPTTDGERRRAELTFFGSPAAYRKIIDRYDGQRVPDGDTLGNVLQRECKIPDSWARRVAVMIKRDAEFLRVIDENGVLRYRAAGMRRSDESMSAPAIALDAATEPSEVAPSSKPSESMEPRTDPKRQPNAVLWDTGRIRIQTPKDMTQEEWEGLLCYVQAMKPKGRQAEE